MKKISFKSLPEIWLKEFKGLKPNTVRFTRDWDVKRWSEYFDALYIEIVNTETKDKFVRKIIDRTRYNNMVIISWKDE